MEQVKVTRERVGRAELFGRNLVGILPVAHPGHHCVAVFRSTAPAHGSVVILTPVHPACYIGGSVACKLVTVEITHEILCRAAAERAPRVDVDNQHPLLLGLVLLGVSHGQLHQVGAFPHTVLTSVLSEAAFKIPFLQVIRREKQYLAVKRAGEHEIPFSRLRVPEHIGVAGLAGGGDDRVTRVDGKCLSVVRAVGEALHLAGTGRGVDGYYLILAETGRVVVVNHAAAAEHATQPVRLDCVRLLGPVHQIGRCRVTPCHVLPFRSVGVVLEVEMPQTILVEHAVRVVHPSVERSVVIGRAVFLLVGGVKAVGELHLVPADEITRFARRGAVGLGHHIQQHASLRCVGGEVKRHRVVYAVVGEARKESGGHIAVDKHVDLCIGHALLDRQDKILRRIADAHHRVGRSEREHLDAVVDGRDCQCRCKHGGCDCCS